MERNGESMVALTGTDQVNGELNLPAAGGPDAENFSIIDNKAAGAYEFGVDGQTAAGLLY